MSETKQLGGMCSKCGWFACQCPAEPVIEVANSKTGINPNANSINGPDWNTAVPAQEALREPLTMSEPNVETICRCGHTRWEHTRKGAAAVNYCGQCSCMDFKLAPVFAEPQAGAQVPSQDEIPESVKRDYSTALIDRSVLRLKVIELEAHLAHIAAYATEAAKTPITRESILAALCQHEWETRHESWICGADTHSDSYEVCTKCGTVQDQTVETVPIPDDLKELYELSKRAKLAGREMVYCGLIERIGRAEAELRARKLTELAQYDEMQGLCRLVLAESGGGK